MHTSSFPILLLACIMTLGISVAQGTDELHLHYSIQPEAREQSGSSVVLPVSIEVYAAMEIPQARRETLAWHFRNAACLAQEFGRAESANVVRPTLPGMVMFYSSPNALAQATGMTSSDRLGQVVARIGLTSGTLHLGRATPYDLYMELGKWFFYQPNFKWGANRADDERHQAQIKRFADYCMASKHWHETGGSNGDLR